MLFRFNFGLKRGGGLGMHSVPIYYMPHWCEAGVYEDSVEYRPSAETFLHLSGISALAAFVLAALIWYAGFPWSQGRVPEAVRVRREVRDATAKRELDELQKMTDEIARQLPPERLAEIERNREIRERELQEELARTRFGLTVIRTVRSLFHWAAFVSLVAVAVLPLVGLPLQKVTIERSGDGDLVIRKAGLWPSTRRWPQGTVDGIRVVVEEDRARTRRLRYTIGWRWMVNLHGNDPASIGRRTRNRSTPEATFFIDYQKQQPAEGDEWPASVRQLVCHLDRLIQPTETQGR